MRYEDRPMNGHHEQNWSLVGILLDIQGAVSRVETKVDRTHELSTTGLKALNDRVDVVHERIDTHLATPPKPERPGWMSYTGLEPKELAGLVLMALTGLGMLSPDLVKAWFGH